MPSLEELQRKELDLWGQWKVSQDKKVLGDLFSSMRPIVNSGTNRYMTSGLPRGVIEGQVKKAMLKGFKTYDPTKGTKLSTWVNTNIQKVYRWVTERTNIGRIPEDRVAKINTFKAVKSELTEDLGRDPSTLELADELNWNISDVTLLQKEMWEDVIESHMDTDPFVDIEDEDLREVMRYIPYELSAEELIVLEHITGYGGKPILSLEKIGMKLGKTVSQVKTIKKRLSKKIEKYI